MNTLGQINAVLCSFTEALLQWIMKSSLKNQWDQFYTSCDLRSLQTPVDVIKKQNSENTFYKN